MRWKRQPLRLLARSSTMASHDAPQPQAPRVMPYVIGMATTVPVTTPM